MVLVKQFVVMGIPKSCFTDGEVNFIIILKILYLRKNFVSDSVFYFLIC